MITFLLGLSILRLLVFPFHIIIAVLILKQNSYRIHGKKIISGGYSKVIGIILLAGGILAIVGLFIPYISISLVVSLVVSIVLGLMDPAGKSHFRSRVSNGGSEFKVRPLQPNVSKMAVSPSLQSEIKEESPDYFTDPMPVQAENTISRSKVPAKPKANTALPITINRDEMSASKPKQKAPAELIVMQSTVKLPRVIPIDKNDFSVGRADGNDLQLLDVTVSRIHARIRGAQGAWYIQDQGARGKIIVNGKPVKAARLNHQDTIQIGKTKFSFVQNLA